MKITILYDNISNHPDLIKDWGWSCFIETENRNILFDTGGNGKFLINNLRKLNLDPDSINDIVISHGDFDHIGGLSAFLNLNQNAIIHVPTSVRGIKYPNKVNYYDKPLKVYDDFFLTGELDNREQSLAIKTEKGLVLIIGCAHPGVEKIISSISKFGKIFAVIGGLHGFDQFEILKNIDKICPTHCTKHKNKIKTLYTDKFIEGGVGTIIEF